MQWMHFAVLAGSSYGVYNFFTKVTAEKFSPTISLMIVTGTAFAISIIGTLCLRYFGYPLIFDKSSIYKPMLSGFFMASRLFFTSLCSPRVLRFRLATLWFPLCSQLSSPVLACCTCASLYLQLRLLDC